MNMLMIVVVALVALCYFGGNYCPAVLKQNKKMLLGVVGGLVLCSFTGMRLEEFEADEYVASGCCDSQKAMSTDCTRMWGEGHEINDIAEIQKEIAKKCQ